jgi:hypothetical protein
MENTITKTEEKNQKMINNSPVDEITDKQFQDALKILNKYNMQLDEKIRVKKELDRDLKFIDCNGETELCATNTSIRLWHLLDEYSKELGLGERFWHTERLKKLNGLSISKFLECRGVGKKTVEELKELCFFAGIKLNP